MASARPALHVLLFLGLCPALQAVPQGVTARASETATGVGGNALSRNSDLSGDGRYVVFYGSSSNLVPLDGNGVDDVFRKDTLTGQIVRASISSAGAEGNSPSRNPAVSVDGTWVAFEISATNLVAGDTNSKIDIFLHDAVALTTVRVSLGNSPFGALPSNGHSYYPAVDDDALLVAFESEATNLAGSDTNGVKDIYLRDLATGVTERISLAPGGVEPDGECRLPALSPDGRWVGFQSDATNLVAGDTNTVTDVFLKDRLTGALTRVSVGTGGIQGNGQSRYAAPSLDAEFIAFGSESSNWVAGTIPFFNVYVHERTSGVTTLASRHTNGSPANNVSLTPDVSREGRWVAFSSSASNLVQGDGNGVSDAFVHDTLSGATVRTSIGPGGVEGNGFTGLASISDDGVRTIFESDATNLIAGDVEAQRDVFYHDRCGGLATPYCTAKVNSQGCTPAIAGSGTPSATLATPFDVSAQQVLNNKSGFLFYGLSPAISPFMGGTKCVAAPTKRTALQGSGGNLPPDDCSGVLSFDFNARIQSGIDPNLVPGTTVYAQYFYRDPTSSFSIGLTDALCFAIQP